MYQKHKKDTKPSLQNTGNKQFCQSYINNKFFFTRKL